jgi:hypothetical protein
MHARIAFAIRSAVDLSDLSHVDKLTAEDEEIAGRDACIPAKGPRLTDTGLEIALYLLKKRLETLKIPAGRLARDLPGRTPFLPRTDVLKDGDVTFTGSFDAQLGQQRSVIQRFGFGSCGPSGLGQQTTGVQPGEEVPRFRHRAKPVKTHGIQALQNVELFTMLGCPSMGLDKPLNILEPGNDAILAGRTSSSSWVLRRNAKFRQQFVV